MVKEKQAPENPNMPLPVLPFASLLLRSRSPPLCCSFATFLSLPPPPDEIQHRQIRQQDVILQSGNSTVAGVKILSDWGYGRVYTVVVVNCTFTSVVGHDRSGGRLFVHASTSGGGDANFNLTDTIEAVEEAPESLNPVQLITLKILI
ncbi:hypothetical protein R6Q57_010194 [Mikania cordata]